MIKHMGGRNVFKRQFEIITTELERTGMLTTDNRGHSFSGFPKHGISNQLREAITELRRISSGESSIFAAERALA